MKLKTLRDFNVPLVKKSGEIISNGLDISQMEYLRQEAIKRIKKMKSDMPEGKTSQEIKNIIIGLNAIINWIKYFFNITKEDLK